MDNYIHYKVLDEIAYPSPDSNGTVLELISNFTPRLTGHVITYAGNKVNPC